MCVNGVAGSSTPAGNGCRSVVLCLPGIDGCLSESNPKYTLTEKKEIKSVEKNRLKSSFVSVFVLQSSCKVSMLIKVIEV